MPLHDTRRITLQVTGIICLLMLTFSALSYFAPTPCFADEKATTMDALSQGDHFLIWKKEGKGFRTLWVQIADKKVKVLKERSDLVVAVPGKLWSIGFQKQRVLLVPCDCEQELAECEKVSEENFNVLKLTDLISGREIRLAELNSIGIGEATYSVSLLGSLGPYLFIKTEGWSFSCGAHGNGDADFFIFDLEKEKPSKILSDPKLRQLLKREAKAALKMIGDGDGDDEEVKGHPERLDLSGIFPDFSDPAKIQFLYQFTGGACYACGDNVWGSYSVTGSASSEKTPKILSAWVSPPAPLAAWIKDQKMEGFRGWSPVRGFIQPVPLFEWMVFKR